MVWTLRKLTTENTEMDTEKKRLRREELVQLGAVGFLSETSVFSVFSVVKNGRDKTIV